MAPNDIHSIGFSVKIEQSLSSIKILTLNKATRLNNLNNYCFNKYRMNDIVHTQRDLSVPPEMIFNCLFSVYGLNH